MRYLPSRQDHLFYPFNLESVVPQKHLLRGIDRCLDLADLRDHLAEYYSHTGRPSIDPELMIRMLVVGYCYGIRSEQRLCEEAHLNLACRWFCRLRLEDVVPNHSAFSKNRHGRFRESGTFRWVFDKVVRACMATGLVKGEGFTVDGSINEKSVTPHILRWDRAERKGGTLSRSDFRWNKEANEYRCPTDKALRCDRRACNNPRSHITKADTIIYRASQCDCASCPEKARCCPNRPTRKITRSIHDDAGNVARAIAKTPQYQQSRSERKKEKCYLPTLSGFFGWTGCVYVG